MKNDREMMQALLDGKTLTDKNGTEWFLNSKNELIYVGSTVGFPAYENVWIKPRTININGFEVPEPLREALNNGETYYLAETQVGYIRDKIEWENKEIDYKWLGLGICHKTIEAAQKHIDALLSFTRINK